MTIVSLADCCRQLSIDPKTLRRWLAQAPFTLQPHPHDARLKGLTDEHLRWLAQAHHRSLATLPQESTYAHCSSPCARSRLNWPLCSSNWPT
jgi:transposase-like protein